MHTRLVGSLPAGKPWLTAVTLSLSLFMMYLPAPALAEETAAPAPEATLFQPAAVVPPGAPIVVDTTADFGGDTTPGDNICAHVPSGGQCTLRAAIMEANARPGADTIILPTGTYTLAVAGSGENNGATGDLDIKGDLTIIGSGGNQDGAPGATVVQAQSIPYATYDRVFHVNPLGAGAVNATFKALTIRHGAIPGMADEASGAGIEFEANGNTSSLYLYNVVVDRNKTMGAPNLQGGYGGGLDLYNYSATRASVVVEKSVISNNATTKGNGGGIAVGNIDLTIRDSTIQGNAPSWEGGYSAGAGLYVLGSAAVTIERSLFHGNLMESTGDGAAIHSTVNSATVTVRNSTFSGNSAGRNGGAIVFGGTGSALTLTNVTMTGNTATSGSGGGLQVLGGTATMHNTIVYGNTAGTGADIAGTVAVASSYNMIGSGAGGLTNGTNGNRIGVNPLLSGLANNGGPTQTHALQKGSPALDAGDNTKVSGSFDQRGRTRIADVVGESSENTTATVDIGAYELSPTIAAIGSQSGNVGQTITVPVSVGGTNTTVTAVSSNGSVVPNDAGHLSVTNPTSPTPTLHITGVAQGATTITVTVTAADGGTETTSFPVEVTGMTDLVVSKSHAGNFRQGGTGTYTITVTNQGTIATNGSTVTVTDTLPVGLNATGMSGTGWNCPPGGTTCTRSDALNGGASYPPITLTVSVTGDPGSVTNQVSVAGGGDGNTANNTAADPTTIDPSSDLEVLVTGPASVVKGGSATNTIFVTNNGPSATSGTITVTDTLPAGLTLTSVSGSDWNCNAVSPIVCTRTTPLPSGSSSSISVNFTVDGNAPAAVTNSATAAHGNDLNAANNTGSRTMTVLSYPDLTVSKSHTGNFRQGGTFAYTITVTNSGHAATDGSAVTVTDTLPAGMTATAIAGGTDWACNRDTLTCTSTKAVPAGQTFPAITLTVLVAENAGSPLTNSVTVAGGGEQNTANNSASDPTSIDQVADLTIAKTDGGAAFTQGQSGTYTLTVTNSGQGPTVGTVTVSDPSGSGYTVTGMSGTGWNCPAGGTTCTRSDALAARASYPAITVTVAIDATTGRTITNTASVAGGGELNTSNNSASDNTSVQQLPDLRVSIAPVGGSFTQGQTGAQYAITVNNAGTGLTSGTVSVAVDSLPPSLSPSGFSGTNWDCNPANLSCTRSDELDGGTAYSDPIILTVDVAPTAPASVTTSVTVAGGDDQNPGNNTGSHTTAVTQKPDLTVALSDGGGFAQGGTGTFTVTVRNSGDLPTDEPASVSVTLPAGLNATTIDGGANWSCDLGALDCYWTGSPVAAGTNFPATITVTVSVAHSAAASLTATAAVSGGGEVATGNNTATRTVTVAQSALAPSVTPDALTAEETLTALGDLMITPDPADGPEVTHFVISQITGGRLFHSNGTTEITVGVITRAEGGAGLRFLPAADLNTPAGDTFSFAVQAALDATGASAGPTTTATVTVTEVNDPPKATADPLAGTEEDTPYEIPVALLTGNDAASTGAIEPGQTVTVVGVSSPSNGTVALNAETGVITFTPAANYNGPAGFTYTIEDNGTTAGAADKRTATGSVTFPVTAVNDLPIPANDTLSAVMEDSGTLTILPAMLLANDEAGPADESAQTLTVTDVVAVTGGSVRWNDTNTAIEFSPEANFHGTARFRYTVRDNGSPAESADGVVFIPVNPVAEAPSVTGDRLLREDTPSGLLVITADPAETDDVTHFWISFTGGTLKLANETPVADQTYITAAQGAAGLIFQPAAYSNSPAGGTFQLVAKAALDDAGGPGASSPTTVTFTVAEVNNRPTANDDTVPDVAEDSAAFTIPIADLLANDEAGTNEAGQMLTLSAISGVVGGTVDEDGDNLVFTPAANYHGPAGFTYTVTDNGTTAGAADALSDTAVVSFTVTPVNDPPVAQDAVQSVIIGGQLTGRLAATDEENSPLTFTVVTSPVRGTLTLNPNGTYQYQATSLGQDSFTFVANDGAAGSNIGTVRITVFDNPPPPVLTITAPLTLTREASITVSGTTTPGLPVQVNGTMAQTDSLGNWSASVTLVEGPNVITASNGFLTRSVTITRDTVPPSLTLTAAETLTMAETVLLTATSEAEARILIDGLEGATRQVSLRMGINRFTATAIDRAGNQSTATVTVHRVGNIPPVRRNLQPGTAGEVPSPFVTVQVPGTAVTIPLQIQIAATGIDNADRQAMAAALVLVGVAQVEAANGETGEQVRFFPAPVTLVFRYDPALVSDPSKLKVYYYDPAGEAWVEVGGTVDTAAHTVTVQIGHFTRFALLAPAEATAPVLGALPATTQSEELTVHGTAPAGATVSLLVNGQVQATATADAQGKVSFTARLAQGNNQIYLTGTGVLASREAFVVREAPAEPEPTFIDVDGHWAAPAIDRMVLLGVVNGYADRTFRPEAPVTRAEFAVMVARLLKLAPSQDPLSFADASQIPAWARGQIAAAVKVGIITGRANGTFDSNALVTRAEVAVMMTRALRYAGIELTAADPAGFTDADQIPAWAREQVEQAVQNGLINGYPNGTFGPDATATRAEAVTMLSRLLDRITQ